MRKNKVLSRTLDWLKHKGVSDRIKKLNTIEKPYEKMNDEDFVLLRNYYCKSMQDLSSLLNRDLPFWK